MARPKKTNLDYFPFDIDFFEDEKIVAIAGEFGIKGELATVKLLCAIYRNGYFIEWNEMLQLKLAKQLPGVSLELLNSIVSRLVKWRFFDPNLFSTARILTSRGVQKRYFEASKRWRQDCKSLPYILVESPQTPVNVAETPVNVAETPVNVAEMPQKKNKRKINANAKLPRGKPPALQHLARLEFEKFYKSVYGEPYYYDAKSAGALKQLLQKITFRRKSRIPPLPVDDDSILQAFIAFLKSIDSNWIAENFSLPIINSHYNEIISKIKLSRTNGQFRTQTQIPDDRLGTDADGKKQKNWDATF